MRWLMMLRKIAKWLPEGILRPLRRWRKQAEAKRRKLEKEAALAQYGTVSGSELLAILREAGIARGGVVFVHCSFNDLFTFSETPSDILNVLRALVGPTGTLLMPAFTSNSVEIPPKLFDVSRTPTYTGIVNEIFRRSPGVIRSLHPRHSICGFGPLAEALLSGHDTCERADGPDSPFDRLRQRDDAFILTLGLPPGYISLLHWTEDFDPSRLPYPVHCPEPVVCQVKDYEGDIRVVKDWLLQDKFNSSLDYQAFSRHYSPLAMKHWKAKGISIGIYPMKSLSNELLALRDQGIIHYS